jgi:hypothetical protein
LQIQNNYDQLQLSDSKSGLEEGCGIGWKHWFIDGRTIEFVILSLPPSMEARQPSPCPAAPAGRSNGASNSVGGESKVKISLSCFPPLPFDKRRVGCSQGILLTKGDRVFDLTPLVGLSSGDEDECSDANDVIFFVLM